MILKFEQDGTLPGGEKSYRLVIDGETIAEGLSLDQVIEAINRRDEEKLGEEHAPGLPQSAAPTAPSEREPRVGPSQSAAPTALPEGASQGREPPAERRRKAALGPFRRR